MGHKDLRWPPKTELLLFAGVPLVLAGLGLTHPMELTRESASSWQNLHILLLPIFPLLGFAPWLIVRGEHRAVRWAVATLGYVYAAFYTALDVLAGIGAGALKHAGAGQEWTSVMFAQGNDLSTYAVWAYLTASVLACIVAARRAGLRALPGIVLVTGAAWSFMSSHIYWPGGVLTMLALAIGWTGLAQAMAAGPDDVALTPQ